MREIKFRCWDKKNKKMLTYWELAKPINWEETSFLQHIIDKDEDKYGNYLGVDNYELMQFTGLKDKNGKEIYEGDIVNFYPYELSNQEQRRSLLIRGIIVFNDNAQFCIRYIDMFEPDTETDYLFKKECEVIGNKYSNPELLKDMGVKHETDKEEEE